MIEHPRCDVLRKDNFGRTPVDMLVYTSSKAIFERVMKRAYPEEEKIWDEGILKSELTLLPDYDASKSRQLPH